MGIYTDDESSGAQIEMYQWSCASCGCVMLMPKSFNDQLRVNHQTFYCLSGHSNVYNKKTYSEEVEEKLMNEYAKNAQLEAEIEKLNKTLLNRFFKP